MTPSPDTCWEPRSPGNRSCWRFHGEKKKSEQEYLELIDFVTSERHILWFKKSKDLNIQNTNKNYCIVTLGSEICQCLVKASC